MTEFAQWPAWLARAKRNGEARNGHDKAEGKNGTNGYERSRALHPSANGRPNGRVNGRHLEVAEPPDDDEDDALRVLAIGAHPDDIELGCGGTLLAHRARGHRVSMLVMSRGESGPQDLTSRVSEQEDAAKIIGADLFWGDFEDAAIPGTRDAVDMIQATMADVRPDVIYTHTPNDSHQDHRAIALASLGAARRSCRVLQYEAPSSLGFTPTLYVDIRDELEGKLDALRAHTSQVLRNGLVDLEAIEAQARYRGFQARVRLAEAFQVERFVWDLGDVRETGVNGRASGVEKLLEEVR
jgi:LmbE family N-acetylglucosaminyl deacetylase